ncbi:zinc transport system substrate-binding protein [Salirhabdus euzebyi]|uniref:Zinc transport system substrate-binding protein n=1 Tax=Salirhabdus euzebyi TaxID=394506 RepID=A0A841PWP7_9BACI|nr:zinc ABC transporter substrate-binding protein [Salirhabdus euzebyi]MBB6452324.1 zinc transport system substrate-binding protein [Salirhabdus euzebyi]
MKKLKRLTYFMIALSIFLSACTDEKTATEDNDNRLKVYTTLYPIEDFVKKIGGEHVEVETIISPGMDIHTYEPTSKAIVNIAKADLFVYSGAGLETFAEKISEAVKAEKVTILEASKGIELLDHVHDHSQEEEHAHEEEGTHEEEHAHEEEGTHEEEHAHEEEGTHEEETNEDAHSHDDGHNHGETDPHVWLDPIRSIKLAENIKDTLSVLSPENKEEFETNFEQLKEDLEELDEEFHSQIETAKFNKILVTHGAYGYWEEAYGLEQISITGLSVENEPSQKELAELIETVTEHGIHYLIYEQNIEPEVAKIIEDEINATPLFLHNLEVLTEEDIQNGEDYFSLMRKNLSVLVKALN